MIKTSSTSHKQGQPQQQQQEFQLDAEDSFILTDRMMDEYDRTVKAPVRGESSAEQQHTMPGTIEDNSTLCIAKRTMLEYDNAVGHVHEVLHTPSLQPQSPSLQAQSPSTNNNNSPLQYTQEWFVQGIAAFNGDIAFARQITLYRSM